MPATPANSVLPTRRESIGLQTGDGLTLVGDAVPRFNTRGTESVRGTSGGEFDAAQGERYDVAAAIEYAEFAELPDVWLLGWFGRVPQAEVVGVDGAKHLWVGDAEKALDPVVSKIAPERSPLPRDWDGPMETADSSAYADRTVAAFGDRPVTEPEET